jgi:hypothetical protein
MENETVIPEPKKRLVRKRRTDLALETALRDAAAACEHGADPATKGLIQTRLNILNLQLTRERNEKLKCALAESERLRAENLRLKQELESRAKPAVKPVFTVSEDIKNFLASHEETK